MNKLSKLFEKLSAKLIIGFSVILAFSIGVNIFAIIQLERAQDVAIEISENWMPSIYTLSAINTNTSDFMNRQQQHIFSLSEVEMAANERLMADLQNLTFKYEQEYQKLLEDRVTKYGETAGYEESKGLFGTYKSTYERFILASNQILELSRINNKEEAKEKMRSESFAHFQDCSQALNLLIADNLSRGTEAANRSRELYTTSRGLITSMSWLSFITSVIIAILIIRGLQRQIGGEPVDIANVTRKVAEGDLTMRFEEKDNISRDSIYSSTKIMVETLREIAELTNNIAKGDLSQRVKVRSEKDLLAISINQMIDNFKEIINQAKVIAKGDYSLNIEKRGEHDELGSALQAMTVSLRNNKIETEEQNWIKDGINQLTQALSGNLSLKELSNKAISFLARYTGSAHAALYIYDGENEILKLVGTFAFTERNSLSNVYKVGEGIVGQVALERSPILLKNIRRSEMVIKTGIIEEPPLNSYCLPLIFENNLYGVLELVSSEPFMDLKKEFLEQSIKNIATYIYSVQQTERIKGLLAISEEATRSAQLRALEIEEVNAKLEEQRKQLQKQSEELRMRNESLISAKAELDRRAEELELSNRYKSEFLANMSHELRTPLNSIIMLSKMLAKNDKSGLGEKEVKKAQIINKSGEELLRLINDILDLSKIEAGKMSIHTSSFATKDLTDDMQDFFEGIASEKQVSFIIDDKFKGNIYSDKERLYQIIRNFLSNAFKFTKEGSVTLGIAPDKETGKVRISVKDTGIGIPEDKQEVIFEAFKQADGTTSREFGGTGLGLSIVRELTKLLQGHIELESQVGRGSTFSLVIPAKIDEEQIDEEGIPVAIKKTSNTYTSSKSIVQIKKSGQKEVIRDNKSEKKVLPNVAKENQNSSPKENRTFNDDRRSIRKGDRVILLVEDEQQFAESMSEVIQGEGFKTIIANTAKDGIELAKQFLPDGIILDLGLPDMDGEEALKLFKSTKEIRHIPIEIVSARDKDNSLLSKGAIGFLQKPIDENALKSVMSNIQRMQEKSIKDLLIVEDDEAQLHALNELLKGDDINVTGVKTKADAMQQLREKDFDAAIVDLGLKDGNGYEVCTFISDNYPNTRVIVYTGRNLKPSEERKLKKATQSIILKTKDAEEKLRDEVALFLHRMEAELDVQNLQRDPLAEKFVSKDEVAIDLNPPVIPVDEIEMPDPEIKDSKTLSIAELLLKELDEDDNNNDTENHNSENKQPNDGNTELTNEPMEFRKKYTDQEAAPIIKNKNILVVDDDVRNIFVIASALENFEANIEEALNGKIALEKLRTEHYDLIMMDTIMPEMDGLEAITAIRANDAWANIPIIAITGKAQYEDKVACLKAGANAYIVKPVDYEQLLSCVCEMLLKNI